MLIDIKKIVLFVFSNYILFSAVTMFHFFFNRISLFLLAIPIINAAITLSATQAVIGLFIVGLYVDAILVQNTYCITSAILIVGYIMLPLKRIAYITSKNDLAKIAVIMNLTMNVVYVSSLCLLSDTSLNILVENIYSVILSQVVAFLLIKNVYAPKQMR